MSLLPILIPDKGTTKVRRMSLDFRLNTDEFNVSSSKSHNGLVYEFERFRLDVEHLMLYQDGEEVSLTPKQVDTLLALLEHRGDIVSKEILINRVWPDTIVEESNLVQNIHFLRKALGTTSDGRPMIETLRGRGYRFNAALNENGQGGMTPKGRPREPMAKIIAAALILFAVAALLGYLFYRAPESVAAGKKQFAVLTPRPIDAPTRDELYENGIADALINRISPVKDFVVRPLSSTRKYSAIDQDPIAVGREQKVDYVLASNYQLADGKVRITTQVYEVSTGLVEKTFIFEKELSGIFSTQDAFASDIGNRLMALFNVRQNIGQQSRGTENEEAYGLYLQGINLSDERGLQNAEKALGYLEKAVSLDPNYAQAWAGIALFHRDLSNNQHESHEHYRKSMDAISKALAIDPNISDAYSALCHCRNRYEYDPSGAETACRRALELDPNSATAHKTYGNYLYSRGRFDESIAEIRIAMELQPVSYQNQQMYGLALYYARQFEESERQFKRLNELNPNRGFVHGWLTEVLDAQGRHAEAFDYLIKKLELEKADTATIEHFKTTYSATGWSGVTRERINTPKAMIIPDSFQLACLYAKVDDKDNAFEYLEKAYQARSFWIAVLEVTPQLDSLRSDPRYHDLVKRINGN